MKNQNVTLKNATILVTGAAGFIGSNLVLELLRTTEPVYIIGIDNIKTNWFLRNLPQSTIITYLIHSTCWLTIFRQSFIMWQINHYGILFTLCMLPLFAFCIYLLATFINIIYEKILGNFFRRILIN